MTPVLCVRSLRKSFTLHQQGAVTLPVLRDIDLDAAPGEAIALFGPSGSGKSTLLRCLYGNYRPDAGSIHVLHDSEPVDLATAQPRQIIEMRRHTIGYVSQFLRVIPRVATIDVVAESALERGNAPDAARDIAADLLRTLNIAERLWKLAPATFSGGEQQRVNVARGLAGDHRLLLVDEPTASLDPHNRDLVTELLCARIAQGTTVIGIFHDALVRGAVATRLLSVEPATSQALLESPADALTTTTLVSTGTPSDS